MTTRLLALILGIIIGSPACWCCEAVAAEAPSQKATLCCHETSQDAQPATGEKEKCPCAVKMAKRDQAPAKAVLPQAFASLLALPDWQSADSLLPVPRTVLAATMREEKSPPGTTRVLYLKHCALLL